MNTVSTEIPSTANSVSEVKQVRHRKFWKPLLSTAVAAVAALGMGLGANTALAAPTDISGYAHVDFVSLNYDAADDAIELGSNYDDTGWIPAGTYSLVVPWTTGEGNDDEGTGYILPQEIQNAIDRKVPFAGFSGDESLYQILLEGDSVDVTLEDVEVEPVDGGSAGTVTVSQNGQPWYATEGNTHTFTVLPEDEEAFHEHTKWEFSQPGTYRLTFSSTTQADGVTYKASPQVYTFKVGL